MIQTDWEDTRFYLVRDGRPQGPFTFEEVKGFGLSGTDFIRTEAMSEFKEIREIPGLSQALHIRYQHAQPQYFATLDTRLLAWGIDLFIALFVYALFAVIYLVGANPATEERVPMILLGLLSVPVFKFMITSWMESSPAQASPGKALVGIKVTNASGGPIGPGKAILRNLAKILGVITLGIGFFIGFFDKKQRCLHDRIAGTLVIRGRLI